MKSKINIILSIIIIVLLIIISIGYIFFYNNEYPTENISLDPLNKLILYKVDTSEVSGASTNELSYITNENNSNEIELTSNVSISFIDESNGYAIYNLQIVNNTKKTYTYKEFKYNYDSEYSLFSPIVTGIKVGNTIKPFETINILVKFYNNSGIIANYDIEFSLIFIEKTESIYNGTIKTDISNNSLNYNDTILSTNINILNTNNTSIEYYLISSNENYSLISDYHGIIDAGESKSINIIFNKEEDINLLTDFTTELYIITTNGDKYKIDDIIFIT